LFGMYDHVSRDIEPKTSTSFLISVRLGAFKNIDLAMTAYRSTIPGLIRNLHENTVFVTAVVGENAVASEFYRVSMMEDI